LSWLQAFSICEAVSGFRGHTRSEPRQPWPLTARC
jgi:hypothetical protein